MQSPCSYKEHNLLGEVKPFKPRVELWVEQAFETFQTRIIDNVRGELQKRQWIVFDGDVDPEWVENLNSVLDDNKLLTLPNGERLSLPPNVSKHHYRILRCAPTSASSTVQDFS